MADRQQSTRLMSSKMSAAGERAQNHTVKGVSFVFSGTGMHWRRIGMNLSVDEYGVLYQSPKQTEITQEIGCSGAIQAPPEMVCALDPGDRLLNPLGRGNGAQGREPRGSRQCAGYQLLCSIAAATSVAMTCSDPCLAVACGRTRQQSAAQS
jgi:hypothetical protein